MRRCMAASGAASWVAASARNRAVTAGSGAPPRFVTTFCRICASGSSGCRRRIDKSFVTHREGGRLEAEIDDWRLTMRIANSRHCKSVICCQEPSHHLQKTLHSSPYMLRSQQHCMSGIACHSPVGSSAAAGIPVLTALPQPLRRPPPRTACSHRSACLISGMPWPLLWAVHSLSCKTERGVRENTESRPESIHGIR